MMIHKYLFSLVPALLLSISLQAQSPGKYFEISKNMEIFANAYREINHGYVDELDPAQVMRRGLDAMLEGLDPFTNYISETDIEGFRIQTDGRYNGVGANGKKMGDYMVVTEIYENSPAHKAGLKVGDRIVAVDGQNAKGRTEQEVMDFVRGYPGTDVTFTVLRPGESKERSINLTREEVNVPNVPHSGLVAENIGYINLTTFTQEAAANIRMALENLKKQNPQLKGLVLDLRGNGGGLLNEAINIINIFVPAGEFVVTTKGKVPEWDNVFRTTSSPLDTDIPVVVLIDHKSASASEVVSGSLQDLDRAVIMGQLSYGKGLVQNTKDIGYNAKIKLTTAKYYIPSGRCIQAVRYKDGMPVDIPENERAKFKTRNGRTVLDGGGVKPDIALPTDTATGIVRALLDQHLIFDYVTNWLVKHPAGIDSIETFSFVDWPDFLNFVEIQRFEYQTASEKKLSELRETALKENLLSEADLATLDQKIKQEKKGAIANNKARIIREIEQEIIGRYFFLRGKVRKRLNNDPEVNEAVRLLNDPTRYQGILSGK